MFVDLVKDLKSEDEFMKKQCTLKIYIYFVVTILQNSLEQRDNEIKRLQTLLAKNERESAHTLYKTRMQV